MYTVQDHKYLVRIYLGERRPEGCDLAQQSVVARWTLDDAVLESGAADLSGPLEGQPPVTAVHLTTRLVPNPGGLVRPHEAGPDYLLGSGEPPSQSGGQPPDAEDVGEEAVSHHGTSDHPALLPLAPRDEATEVEGEAVRPGQEAVLFPPSLYHQRHVETLIRQLDYPRSCKF